jgi:hypothetical protein
MLGGEAAAKAGFTVEEVVAFSKILIKNQPISDRFFCVGWREFSSL